MSWKCFCYVFVKRLTFYLIVLSSWVAHLQLYWLVVLFPGWLLWKILSRLVVIFPGWLVCKILSKSFSCAMQYCGCLSCGFVLSFIFLINLKFILTERFGWTGRVYIVQWWILQCGCHRNGRVSQCMRDLLVGNKNFSGVAQFFVALVSVVFVQMYIEELSSDFWCLKSNQYSGWLCAF